MIMYIHELNKNMHCLEYTYAIESANMYTYIEIEFDIGRCDIGRCPTRHTYIQCVFTYQHNNFSDISAMNLGEIVTATRHPSYAALYTLAMRTKSLS